MSLKNFPLHKIRESAANRSKQAYSRSLTHRSFIQQVTLALLQREQKVPPLLRSHETRSMQNNNRRGTAI